MKTQPETNPTKGLQTGHGLIRRIVSLFRKPPRVRMLYLEVTHRCNARCITCYTKAGKEKPDVLTFEEKKSVVSQAKALGAKAVSLSGSGEPLLYERLFDLIDYTRNLGMQVVIFTNGTMLDERAAERLMGRGVITYFKLYSLDPAVFDRMMGRTDAYAWASHTYTYNDMTRQVRIPTGLKYLLDAQTRKAKRREDRRVACSESGRYFRTCPARQYFEAKHQLPCDY